MKKSKKENLPPEDEMWLAEALAGAGSVGAKWTNTTFLAGDLDRFASPEEFSNPKSYNRITHCCAIGAVAIYRGVNYHSIWGELSGATPGNEPQMMDVAVPSDWLAPGFAFGGAYLVAMTQEHK